MKQETINRHLKKLLGEGYIVYTPLSGGYSLNSFKAKPTLLNKIKEACNAENMPQLS